MGFVFRTESSVSFSTDIVTMKEMLRFSPIHCSSTKENPGVWYIKGMREVKLREIGDKKQAHKVICDNTLIFD